MAGFDASWFSARYADAAAHRARLAGIPSWRWPDLAIDDAGSPLAGFNQVTALAPIGPALAPLHERLAKAFGASAAAGFRLVSAWPTPDLTVIGLFDPSPSACMVRPIDETRPSPSPAPPSPAELTIRRVTTAADLSRFELVLNAGFGDQPIGAVVPTTLLKDGSIRLWLGIVGGEAVSCSATYLVEGAVGVDHIATVPKARGRGYATALTWQATRADPSVPAFLEASALGRPIYERLGYRLIGEAVAWSGRADGVSPSNP